MGREPPLSEPQEMYLKTLYKLQEEHGAARVEEVADGLGVRPSSAADALKRLERRRLVHHGTFGLVSLTPSGSRMAGCVVRRFETLRAVLEEVFGVDPEVASLDACRMEHGLSPSSLRSMQRFLDAVRSGEARRPGRPGGNGPVESCSKCEGQEVCAVADPRSEAQGSSR